jgi:hypothetical protein
MWTNRASGATPVPQRLTNSRVFVQDSDHGQDALDAVKDAFGNLTGGQK